MESRMGRGKQKKVVHKRATTRASTASRRMEKRALRCVC
jgi:hypothetical protein